MFCDVVELREFYTSPLGRYVQAMMRRKVLSLWPNLKGLNVAVIGYGTPLLRPFLEETEHAFALMPAQQGVIHWPKEAKNLTTLVDETALPLADESLDGVILFHALEGTRNPEAMLQDIWRVLKGNGRLIVIAPNRTGLWAQLDHTPFGQGAAFSLRQIKGMLKKHLFIPEKERGALYMPPTRWRLMHKASKLWEGMGSLFFHPLAGVWVVECAKQLYAPLAGKTYPAKKAFVPLSQPSSIGLRVS